MSTSEAVSGDTISPLYSAFDIVTVDYKHVDSVAISASILIPKTLRSETCPITVHWHGGGFGTGHRLFADWYAEWTLTFPRSHSSIIISPDYRLLPQANGLDILQDCTDFYTWLFDPTNLASCLPHSVKPDLHSVLVLGESAGGWIALQSEFLHPGRISAVIAQYPMIDLKDEHFSSPPPPNKLLFDPPVPQVDPSMVSLGSMEDEPLVVPNRIPPDGLQRMIGWIQQGLYPKVFGTHESFYLLDKLDHTVHLPPVWIVHGIKDSLVPVRGTQKFERKFREKMPLAPLLVTYVEAGEHGFDNHDEPDWTPLRGEGVKFVEKYWPVKQR